jgi:hypothetical protein
VWLRDWVKNLSLSDDEMKAITRPDCDEEPYVNDFAFQRCSDSCAAGGSSSPATGTPAANSTAERTSSTAPPAPVGSIVTAPKRRLRTSPEAAFHRDDPSFRARVDAAKLAISQFKVRV